MKNTFIFFTLFISVIFISFGKNTTSLDFISDDISKTITTSTQSSIANNDNRLKIRLELFTSTNFHREILLTIDKRSTNSFDKGYDAMLNVKFPNDIYWMLDDDKLVIQAFNELPEDRVVPIGIVVKESIHIKINVASIENPYPNMEVYLRDNLTMDTYDIKDEIFEIDLEEGEYNDKYSVVFVPKVNVETNAMLDVVENIEVQNELENIDVINELRVFVGAQNEFLKIRKPEEIKITNISMYNMIGQQIKVWNSNLNESEINLPIYVDKGIHLVLMDTEKGRLMKKILIK